MRKLVIPFIAIGLIFTSCEKEQTEFGSQMTIRNVTSTSVDVTATFYVTGTEQKLERGFKYYKENQFAQTLILAEGGNGTVDATITDLEPNTSYTIYPYVYNGSWIAGEEKTFTTN